MNGVRRLWGGGRASPSTNSQPSSPPPEPPPLPSPATAATTTSPANQLRSPQLSPLGDEPAITTPGLVIRKGKTKQKTPATSPTGNQGLFPSFAISHKLGSDGTDSPIDPLLSDPSSLLASPARSALASKPGESTWPSELVSIQDGLLMSLLTSEAMVDSRACEILSAEEVAELKKVWYLPHRSELVLC